MTTDTPSSRDEEIPTLLDPQHVADEVRLYTNKSIRENAAYTIEELNKQLIRLSAEREKERPVANRDVPTLFPTLQSEIKSLRATLAERDKELAEERADVQTIISPFLKRESELEAQLLAAQTVISLLKKFRANHGLQHSGICAYRPGQLNMNCTCGCDELTDSLLASPDPTLLDEVKREKEDALKLCDELLEMVEEYHNCNWEDEPFTPDIDGLAKRISRLRQSTRETEEKV